MPSEAARLHAAWLLWCIDQGYTHPDDRALMTNWLLEDPSTLHPDDALLRPQLLTMVDELLAALGEVTDVERVRRSQSPSWWERLLGRRQEVTDAG